MSHKPTKLIRITTNNQVAIPASIVRELNLSKGSYLEVEEKDRQIIMTPKRIVSEEDFAMYETHIRKGREQIAKGEYVSWEEVKRKADLLKKASKAKKAA